MIILMICLGFVLGSSASAIVVLLNDMFFKLDLH